MTQYVQNAEGGTAGANVTTANSGGASGQSFSLVSITGTPTITYSATGKAHGALGYRAQNPGASTDRFYMRLTLPTPVDFFSDRTYFTLNAIPPNAVNIIQFIGSDGSANQLGLGMLSNGTLRAANAAGATLSSYTTALTAGALYRVETQARRGTGTTDGQVAVQLYAGDSTTALWTYNATNVNAGTLQFGYKYLGGNTASTPLDITFDDVLFDDASQAPLGPYASAPTTSVVPTSLVSGTGWTVTGAADIPTALADALDTSYAISPDSPVNSTLIVGTNGNLTAGSLTVTPRMAKRDATTTATAKVTLLNSAGTAVAAEQTYTLTTTPTDYPYTLTTVEANALTGRSGLQWRIVATA